MTKHGFNTIIYGGTLALSICTQANAQLVRNYTGYRAVVPMIIADANYPARRFNVPVKELYSVSGDHFDEVFGNIQQSIGGTSTYYGLGLEASAYATSLASIFSVISPWSVALWMAEIYAAEQNTQRRIYEFYVPVESDYNVTCYLKGDWDYPRNRVGIFDKNGNQVFNYDHQRSSDGLATFRVHMTAGIYSSVVALGSGSSILLHTAGNLQSVVMDSPNYIQWTTPFVVSEKRCKLIDYLPNVGSINYFDVNFGGYPSNNPNLIDGTVAYSNLRVSNSAPIGSLDGTPLGTPRAINKAITFILPMVSTVEPPTFNGVTAIFKVQRDADDIWTDDPGNYAVVKGKKK